MKLVRLREQPEMIDRAARWFHEKWGIPEAAYRESMAAMDAGPVPQWLLLLDGERICGGLGVIENDFHERPDLTPNICAVYVEPEYRCRGLAGLLLRTACADLAAQGVKTCYLLTDHTGFYERYGWEFLCMVKNAGEESCSRMYVHHS